MISDNLQASAGGELTENRALPPTFSRDTQITTGPVRAQAGTLLPSPGALLSTSDKRKRKQKDSITPESTSPCDSLLLWGAVW